MRKSLAKARTEHDRWLKQHGVHPEQLKRISKPKWEYNLAISEDTINYRKHSRRIPGSGVLSPTSGMDRRKACEAKYTVAPAYNKGPYMVVSKDDIKTMGRKV